MNLTEPPRILDPSPDRIARIRTDLVDQARRDLRPQRQRRTWIPVVAATASVAMVAAGVAVASRHGGAGTGPVIGTPTATASTPGTTTTVPPNGTITGDFGPASDKDTRNALRRCFLSPGGTGFRPADAATAKVQWSRWMVKPASFGTDNRWHTEPTRQLVVSVLRADQRAWALCADDPGSFPGGQMLFSSSGTGIVTNSATARQPVNGGANGGGGLTSDGRWLVSWKSGFDALPRIARADFRITWSGGASAWHTAYIHNGTGYVEVTATGTGSKPDKTQVQVRLLDEDGHVFYRTSGAPDVPLGVK
jgi:hypothetical protein